MVGHVECPDGTTHQFFGVLMAVEDDLSISAYTLELQEVATTVTLLGGEHLIIYSLAVQVAVTQLTIAVVVVEVMGEVDLRRNGIATNDRSRPIVVERDDGAAAFTLGGGEVHLATPHGNAGGHGNAALLVIVDGAVEVIHYTVVFYHVALVGKHLVVGFRRDDEVCSRPVLPVDEVATDGEGVVGVVLAVGVIGREVEHDVEGGTRRRSVGSRGGRGHADNLGIAGDDAWSLVEIDGVRLVTLPFLEVIA